LNISGISEKNLIGKLLRIPLRLIPKTTILPILQGRLKGKKWIVGSSNHGCWLGSYEFRKRQVFEGVIVWESIVFDIGAHVGFYTLLTSVLVGPNGKVYAFEPMPENIYYLKEHLRINQISNVRIIEAAVSDRCGVAQFKKTNNSYTGHLSLEGDISIETVSLDELISKDILPAPHYIKIDVEGAEMNVLAGARCFLMKNHPTLFLATHGDKIHKQCCQLLGSIGYHLIPIDGQILEQTDELLAYYVKK
jgi:FkbM family methyltransferase